MTGVAPQRRAWPLVLGAFVAGLAIALLLPGRSGGGEEQGATATAAAGEPVDAGSSGVLRGTPVGFARTEQGAVSAAAAFICTGQALLDMDPLSAENTVRAFTAAGSADDFVDRHLTQLAQARDVLAAGTGPVVYRQSAIAWRVEAFDGSRARVAIWNVGVLSREGVAPPQAGWATSVVDLVWERGGWRVWGETVTPGPTPIADDSDAPSTSAELMDALEGFTDFGAAQ